MKLTTNDKFNIYNAYATEHPMDFFHHQFMCGSSAIDRLYDYIKVRVDLTPYINEYLKLTSNDQRRNFYLKYKKK